MTQQLVYEAAKTGDIELLRRLVSEHGVACTKGKNPTNCEELPIHIAARNGFTDVVAFFVEKCDGDPINNGFGVDSALALAARNGHLATVAYLAEAFNLRWVTRLERAVQLAGRKKRENDDRNKYTYYDDHHDPAKAMLMAAREGRTEIVKFFVQELGYPADCTDGSRFRRTALHEAASSGHLDVVQFLVEFAGANVLVEDASGNTPLGSAVSNRKINIVRYFVQRDGKGCGLDINFCCTRQPSKLWTAVHHAVNSAPERGIVFLKFLVEECDANIDTPSVGPSPLTLAAKLSSSDALEYLLRCGADVNATQSGAYSPFCAAAGLGSLYSLQALADCGADIEEAMSSGVRAIHAAAEYEDISKIEFLVFECGADVNVRKGEGDATPLHMILAACNLDVALWLVRSGHAIVDLRDGEGRTPLDILNDCFDDIFDRPDLQHLQAKVLELERMLRPT